MTFLLDIPDDASPELVASRFESYRRYLSAQRGRMPEAAFELASAPWHYDARDHRCPHDAWVESISLLEQGSGQRSACELSSSG